MNRLGFLKTGAIEALDVASQAIGNLRLRQPQLTPTETLCANLSMNPLILS